jgi:hypothetical protein
MLPRDISPFGAAVWKRHSVYSDGPSMEGFSMRRRWVRALTGVLLAAAVAGPLAGAEKAKKRVQISSFAVVVSTACPAASLTYPQLSALFLKSAQTWPDGSPARPQDLGPDSPVRAGFSLVVHGRPTADIQAYWKENQALGAPPELASDEEVFRVLREDPQAIGYVSGEATLPEGIRILPIAD